MKNLICTVEARMGSTRLPGKSMLFLNKKYRLIDFVILNALNSKYINNKNLYLLTSKSINNFSLANYVKKKYKIKIIYGSEENVFSRYNFFKKKKKLKIIRLTGDNPIIDPLIIDKFIEFYNLQKIDYASTRSMSHSKKWKVKSDYPKGIALEIFESKKLFKNEKNFNKFNCEYPTWFFFKKEKKEYKIKKFKAFEVYKKFNLKKSYTIDTKEDYIKIKKLIKKYNFQAGKNNFYRFLSSKNNEKS